MRYVNHNIGGIWKMSRIPIYSLIFGIVGLVAGYFLFGRIAGEYISIDNLIKPADNIFKSLGNAMIGIEQIRWNIILCGVIGVSTGTNVALLTRRW